MQQRSLPASSSCISGLRMSLFHIYHIHPPAPPFLIYTFLRYLSSRQKKGTLRWDFFFCLQFLEIQYMSPDQCDKL